MNLMVDDKHDDLRIDLLATPATAGLARTLMEQRLLKWNLLDISDDALLVVSEIVANACEATPLQEIRLHFSRSTTGVLIAVWDCSADVPVANPVVELTETAIDRADEDRWDSGGGWGLPIVQALSADCGYRSDPAGGKWIWARLGVPTASAHLSA